MDLYNVRKIVSLFQSSRERPKFGFGFGYGAETGDIFSFGYSRNREARFQPTFGYGQKYKRSKLPLLAIS